jgi:protein-export membrane protein SecD
MRLILLLTALFTLAACEPKSAADVPGAILVLELDTELLLDTRLHELSTDIREELRQQPIIPLDPIGGRKVERGHVIVTPSNAEHIPAAIQRIGKLGQFSVAESGGGAIEVGFTESGFRQEAEAALAASVEAVKRRISLSGFNGAEIQTSGDRIMARIPRLTDSKDLASLGKLVGRAGILSFNLVDLSADPGNYHIGVEQNGRMALPDDSLDGLPQVIFTDAIIHGDEIANANQGYDERNLPEIEFQLTPDGTRKFARATKVNIGRPFAIVFDNRIVSAPNIQSPILSGSGRITGSFTREEAEVMAIVLRSGALPAPLRLIGTRVTDGKSEKR